MRGSRGTAPKPGTPVITVNVADPDRAVTIVRALGWKIERVFFREVRITVMITLRINSVDAALNEFWKLYNAPKTLSR